MNIFFFIVHLCDDVVWVSIKVFASYLLVYLISGLVIQWVYILNGEAFETTLENEYL